MVDDIEAKLASARDSGLAAVTAVAATGCLDAQALAALDSTTAAQVSAIDAAMPQAGPPSGSGAPTSGSPTGGGSSGGYALAGGDGISSAQGLPPCSGTALLDHVPTSDVASIEPLGHMYGEHIVPVQADHIYLQPSPSGPAVTVYAPGNVTLLQVVAQTHTGGADVGLGTDYTVKFSPCSTVMFGYVHLRTLSDAVHAALSGIQPACGSRGTLASNCVYGGLSIKLSSGDVLGTGLGSGYALDFGATDVRTTTLDVSAMTPGVPVPRGERSRR